MFLWTRAQFRDADQKFSGFSDDFSAEIYSEIESTCLEVSDGSLVNWKLFYLHSGQNVRLHDVRFVVPAERTENTEATIEAHTTRLNELKRVFDQATNQEVAAKYTVELLVESCNCCIIWRNDNLFIFQYLDFSINFW